MALISMPWEMLEIPSLQIGTLEAVLRREGVPVVTRVYKFDFIDRCVAGTADLPADERLGVKDYLAIALRGETALGDWVFAVPPFAPPDEAKDAAYLELLQREFAVSEKLIRAARRFREQVAPFAIACADDLARSGARLVGFSSTFSQNVPSLLVAKLLKARAPDVKIVFGGSNFDGAMGAAIHTAYPWVDYVVRGEGERALVQLAKAIVAGTPVPRFAGLCHREDGSSVAEPESRETVPMADVPQPRFDDYFDAFERSGVRAEVTGDVRLMYETSRGCWWGEKSHCTFCGLNGMTMKFRSKDPDTVIREIQDLARRHRRLDFQLVDNILDMGYLRTVLPRLKELGFDLRLFYETKSNLRRDQVKLLADSGVDRIQPGIESLSTPILKRMKKGVTAIQNIRLLKWGAEYGVGIYWNMICGFPGEPIEEYARMADLIPSLTHLDAPEIGTLRVDRFSPYHQDPAAHGIEILGARAHFKYVYDLPASLLGDLAYTFEYRHEDGRDVNAYSAALRERVGEWRAHNGESVLLWRRGPGFVVVNDRRHGLPHQDYYLEEEAGVAFEACADGAPIEAAGRAIREAGYPSPKDGELEAILGQLIELRLAIEEDGRYLTLALPARPRAVKTEEVPVERTRVRLLPLAG